MTLHDPASPEAPDGWDDAVARGALHPFWSWQVVRAAGPGVRGTPVVASFRDSGKIVGVGAGWIRFGGDRWPHLGVVDVKCVGPGCLPGLALLDHLPNGLGIELFDTDLFATARRAFEQAVREHYSSRLWFLYREMYSETLPTTMRSVSVAFVGPRATVLPFTFDSFDGYLKTLSQSRRASLRRLLRQFDAKTGLDISIRKDPQDLDHPAMKRLADETARRNHRGGWSRPRAYDTRVRRALTEAPGSWVLRYQEPAGLLAWGITYDHPTMPVAGAWGAHDAKGQGGHSGIWFDQLARTVRHTIELGRSGLIEGKGQNAIKVDCGFTEVPRWSVLCRPDRRS